MSLFLPTPPKLPFFFLSSSFSPLDVVASKYGLGVIWR